MAGYRINTFISIQDKLLCGHSLPVCWHWWKNCYSEQKHSFQQGKLLPSPSSIELLDIWTELDVWLHIIFSLMICTYYDHHHKFLSVTSAMAGGFVLARSAIRGLWLLWDFPKDFPVVCGLQKEEPFKKVKVQWLWQHVVSLNFLCKLPGYDVGYES